MVSVNSVLNLINKAKGDILILMQEGDNGQGVQGEWAEKMYQAWETLGEAEGFIEEARHHA